MPLGPLHLAAPAKVNLGLRVLGRRPDGYHEIETVFLALALHDDLIAERIETGVQLEVEICPSAGAQAGGTVPPGEDNLVCRAARCFFAAVPEATGARFHLTKRIPSGAGLGGGSSDAAAALILLNHLLGEPLDEPALLRLASGLGADVPFFLRCGCQLGRGIGDRLTPLAWRETLHLLLVLPPFPCETAEVYKKNRAHLTGGAHEPRVPEVNVLVHKGLAVSEGLHNDLESSAMKLYPALAALREQIIGHGFGDVCMSGSGSTLFLTFPREQDAKAARRRLATLREGGVELLCTRAEPLQTGPSATNVRVPGPARWPGGKGYATGGMADEDHRDSGQAD